MNKDASVSLADPLADMGQKSILTYIGMFCCDLNMGFS